LPLKCAWTALDVNLPINGAAAWAGDLGVTLDHLSMQQCRRGATQPEQPEHDAES